MRLLTWLLAVVEPRLAVGQRLKLQHAYPEWRKMVRALRPMRGTTAELNRDKRIVVVGLGVSALACSRELVRAGCTKITVVAQDAAFGGKCVNIGCMPVEFLLAHGSGALRRLQGR